MTFVEATERVVAFNRPPSPEDVCQTTRIIMLETFKHHSTMLVFLPRVVPHLCHEVGMMTRNSKVGCDFSLHLRRMSPLHVIIEGGSTFGAQKSNMWHYSFTR